MRRVLVVVAVVALLAGCSGIATDDDMQLPDDVGVVDNVSYDEAVAVTTQDGLNQSELAVLADRAMARIEVIRGQAFDKDVEIAVRTREDYRSSSRERDPVDVRWRNQVWQALFLVGQDRDVTAVMDRTRGESVQGYYTPTDEKIVVITDGDAASLGTETLVHELVHAFQDQQFGLDTVRQRRDPRMARDGVVEGEAEVVTERYFERCGSEWSCVDRGSPGGDSSNVDPGILRVLLHPYQSGAAFIEHTVERGGWEAVSDLHDSYPESTAQISYPETYPDDTPVNVSVPDRSGEDWERLDHTPEGETVGQAAIHVMLWQNGVIDIDTPYSYRDDISEGWAGDELVPYENGDASGYVWQLEWENVKHATQFAETYRDLLAEHGGMERGPRQFVISEGPYAGAYDVYHDGTAVTIVRGPDIDSLTRIHHIEG
ncbi:hypothetical protein SAMN05216226_11732 [Halovenus aranensis]|uniref:Lipoprotein n=1 Tax=Halovenus aranensis TaxID=890420 RepID=A0A1G8Z2L9_9EURY|nr:Hvo_1808 family surface protein [Halovenus aranensis]SDK08595.1 hypothetical protein SAMN05216226_11732 [Halovenus aranensis]